MKRVVVKSREYGEEEDRTEALFLRLRRGLLIDKHGLDNAILEQPQLYFEVSEKLASLIDQRDAAKEELTSVEADIAVELRERYDRDGTRYSQNSIASEVTQDQRRVDAAHHYLEMRKLVNKWTSLKESYEQRARMLSHMAKLWVSQYYADPTTNTVEGKDAVVKRVREHQRARYGGKYDR